MTPVDRVLERVGVAGAFAPAEEAATPPGIRRDFVAGRIEAAGSPPGAASSHLLRIRRSISARCGSGRHDRFFSSGSASVGR